MFKHESPTGMPPSIDDDVTKVENGEGPKNPTGVSFTSPVGLLTRLSQHIKRRTYSVQVLTNSSKFFRVLSR